MRQDDHCWIDWKQQLKRTCDQSDEDLCGLLYVLWHLSIAGRGTSFPALRLRCRWNPSRLDAHAPRPPDPLPRGHACYQGNQIHHGLVCRPIDSSSIAVDVVTVMFQGHLYTVPMHLYWICLYVWKGIIDTDVPFTRRMMLLMQEHYMECLFSTTVLAVSTTVIKDVPNPRNHAIKNGRFYHS